MKTKRLYIDHEGNTVIDAGKFQGADSFSEGMAAIQMNYRWGFIDQQGSMTIEPQFYGAGKFSEGLALVLTSENPSKWSFIDQTGEIKFEAGFDRVYDFSEGTAVAEKANDLYLIDKNGNSTFFLNTEEKQIGFRQKIRFSHGLIAAYQTNTNKWGFLDITGRFMIAPQFENAADFSEKLARVSVIENDWEMVGFINTAAAYVIPPKIDVDFDFDFNSLDFSEGLAGISSGPPTTESDPHFIYIDRSGEIFLQTTNFHGGSFVNELALVIDENDRYGYINKSGKLMIPSKYDMAQDFSEGLALVLASQ